MSRTRELADFDNNFAGAIAAFAMNTPPNGWLECDGSAVSRTTYNNLFDVIGTAFGAGDGSTTFDLPDLRGEFIRGWDNARGVDTSRTFGSSQGDAIRNLTGMYALVAGSYGALASTASATGVFTAGSTTGNRITGTSSTGYELDFDASLQVSTGDDNRPRNIALMYCVKY